MSWSVTFIGKPEHVVSALDRRANEMEDGQSKIEYTDALPHIKGLVSQNFGVNPPVVKVAASGHGYAREGKQESRQCAVSIELIYGELVTM